MIDVVMRTRARNDHSPEELVDDFKSAPISDLHVDWREDLRPKGVGKSKPQSKGRGPGKRAGRGGGGVRCLLEWQWRRRQSRQYQGQHGQAQAYSANSVHEEEVYEGVVLGMKPCLDNPSWDAPFGEETPRSGWVTRRCSASH